VFRDAPIKKGKSYSLSFPKPLWNEPILSANYDLQDVLLKRVAGLQKKTNTAALQVKIYNHLLTNAYLGIPTLEAMAANLNTSARSLQRKLQEEGTSYQLIADAVRKSLALYYLQSGNHALKEISYILGYNELSAFTRAFKRWTGTPPAQYQKA
jgi:AraC-like DNA-binding protein